MLDCQVEQAQLDLRMMNLVVVERSVNLELLSDVTHIPHGLQVDGQVAKSALTILA